MLDARDELTRLQARDPTTWTWGRLHRLDLDNQTLGKSGIGAGRVAVQPRPWEVGGGGSIVNATVVGRRRGLRGDRGAVDADGRVARRLRRLPLDQPHRRLRPPRSAPLHRPDRPVGRRARPCPGCSRRTPSRRPGEDTLTLGRRRRLTGPSPGEPRYRQAQRPRPASAATADRAGRGARPARRARPRRRGAARVTGPDRHPRQRPVVAPAAAPEPVAAARDGEPRAPARRRRSRPRRRRAAARPARAARARAGASDPRPGVDRPVQVEVGQHHRQEHPLARAAQRVEQQAGAGLAADRDVRRHGGRPAYLRRGQQVLGSRPRRGLAQRAGGRRAVSSWSRRAASASRSPSRPD